jgi:hypothetical protein
MEQNGEPLAKGDVTARIVAPSGKSETVRLTEQGDEWGAFAGHFTTDELGKHEVTLNCKQTGAKLETSFFVQGAAVEPIGHAARLDVLEEIARVTRGSVIPDHEIDKIIHSLAALPQPDPEVRRVQLWGNPLVMVTFVTLLGVFWVARKAAGLI